MDTGGSYIVHPDGRRELAEAPTRAGSGPRMADGTPIGADGTAAATAVSVVHRARRGGVTRAKAAAVQAARDAGAVVLDASAPAVPPTSQEA